MKPHHVFLKIFRKIISLTLIAAFAGSSLYIPQAQAGEMVLPRLPLPGAMVHLSPEFTPAHLQGLTIHPENALQFDFLIHQGDGHLDENQKKIEYTKLVKYFLASLTIPDEDQWVNLSPYEHNRIIKDDFGKTEMGRDLLSQDYLLKQITSSLMYPEDGLGKKFWDRIYERAYKEYGTTDVPVNTFNKVWIIPDEAAVYESGNTVYILRNHLKVMLEEDYLSLEKHSAISAVIPANGPVQTHTIASRIVKEIILPELEKEVNEGKNFAMLRQIYSGMILATWYKHALKESLLGKVYANKARVSGVDQKDPQANEAIYHRYLKAFKKGVFNFIKEDTDKYSQQLIPRKYFAGGLTGFAGEETDPKNGFEPARLVDLNSSNIGQMNAGMRNDIDIEDTIEESAGNVDKATVALDANKDAEIDRAQLPNRRDVFRSAKKVAKATVVGALIAQGNDLLAQNAAPAVWNHMDVLNGYIHRFGLSWISPDKLFAFDKTADDILKGELSSIKDPRDQAVFKDFYTRLVIEAQAWTREHDPKLFTYTVVEKLANDIAGQYKGVTVSGKTIMLPKKSLVLDPFFKGFWTDFVVANVSDSKNSDVFNKKAETAADYIDKRLGDIVRQMIKAFAALNESPYGKNLEGDALQQEEKRLEDQRVLAQQKVQALIQQFNESYLLHNGRLITFRYNDEIFNRNYSIQAYKIKDSYDVKVLGDPVKVVRADRIDLTRIQAEFDGLSFQGRDLILIDLTRAHDSAWDFYNAARDDKVFAAQFPKAKEWFDNNYKSSGSGVMGNIIKIMERLILAHELGHQLQHKLGVGLIGSKEEDTELVARVAEGLINPKFALADHFTYLLPSIRQYLAQQERIRKEKEEGQNSSQVIIMGGTAPMDLNVDRIRKINFWLENALFEKDSKEGQDNLFNKSDSAITSALEDVFKDKFIKGKEFVDEFKNVLGQINQAMAAKAVADLRNHKIILPLEGIIAKASAEAHGNDDRFNEIFSSHLNELIEGMYGIRIKFDGLHALGRQSGVFLYQGVPIIAKFTDGQYRLVENVGEEGMPNFGDVGMFLENLAGLIEKEEKEAARKAHDSTNFFEGFYGFSSDPQAPQRPEEVMKSLELINDEDDADFNLQFLDDKLVEVFSAWELLKNYGGGKPSPALIEEIRKVTEIFPDLQDAAGPLLQAADRQEYLAIPPALLESIKEREASLDRQHSLRSILGEELRGTDMFETGTDYFEAAGMNHYKDLEDMLYDQIKRWGKVVGFSPSEEETIRANTRIIKVSYQTAKERQAEAFIFLNRLLLSMQSGNFENLRTDGWVDAYDALIAEGIFGIETKDVEAIEDEYLDIYKAQLRNLESIPPEIRERSATRSRLALRVKTFQDVRDIPVADKEDLLREIALQIAPANVYALTERLIASRLSRENTSYHRLGDASLNEKAHRRSVILIHEEDILNRGEANSVVGSEVGHLMHDQLLPEAPSRGKQDYKEWQAAHRISIDPGVKETFDVLSARFISGNPDLYKATSPTINNLVRVLDALTMEELEEIINKPHETRHDSMEDMTTEFLGTIFSRPNSIPNKLNATRGLIENVHFNVRKVLPELLRMAGIPNPKTEAVRFIEHDRSFIPHTIGRVLADRLMAQTGDVKVALRILADIARQSPRSMEDYREFEKVFRQKAGDEVYVSGIKKELESVNAGKEEGNDAAMKGVNEGHVLVPVKVAYGAGEDLSGVTYKKEEVVRLLSDFGHEDKEKKFGDQEIADLFKDETFAQNLVELASVLRVNFKDSRDQGSLLSPLSFGIKKNIFFKIGTNLYISPVTESFRRHSIFKTDDQGNVISAYEFMIPGDQFNKKSTQGEYRKKVADDINGQFSGYEYSVRIVGNYNIPYKKGRNIYKGRWGGPNMDIALYDLSHDGPRLTNITPQMKESLAKQLNITTDELERRITRETMECFFAAQYAGYRSFGDFHRENYRLDLIYDGAGKLIDTKVVLVGDFGSFTHWIKSNLVWASFINGSAIMMHALRNTNHSFGSTVLLLSVLNLMAFSYDYADFFLNPIKEVRGLIWDAPLKLQDIAGLYLQAQENVFTRMNNPSYYRVLKYSFSQMVSGAVRSMGFSNTSTVIASVRGRLGRAKQRIMRRFVHAVYPWITALNNAEFRDRYPVLINKLGQAIKGDENLGRDLVRSMEQHEALPQQRLLKVFGEIVASYHIHFESLKLSNAEFRDILQDVYDRDHAMDSKGGIDFNSANLHLQIKRDGRGVPLPLLQQDWVQLSQIDGFIPTIIEIRPATNLPILSELQQKLRQGSTSQI